MGADDVVFGICLSAVERANGRRSTNAIVVMCLRIDGGERRIRDNDEARS